MLSFDKNKYIHFIAIGGIGMSALAKYLLEAGYMVSGSDIKENKNTQKLKEMGAKIFIGHNPSNISKDTNAVVISTAIKENNQELIKAKDLGIKVLHRSDLLEVIFSSKLTSQKRVSIGASGTHGKTTTSGLMAFVLEENNLNPSYIIGGILPKYSTNSKFGKGDFIVAELDESDGSIVKYSPDITLITNIEVDHVDFYNDGLNGILKTFKSFLKGLKKDSIIVANKECKNTQKLLKGYKGKVFYYSIEDKSADFCALNINLQNNITSFDLYKQDDFVANFEISIPGLHNISNALGSIACLLMAGVDAEKIKKIKNFSGMGRRFDKVASVNKIEIIDDYAHHPSEIEATLKTASNMNFKRTVAIFQPHRYTRFKMFWDEFKEALNFADKKIILDVYPAGEEKIEGFESKDFANQTGFEYIKGSIKEASAKIANNLQEDDIVLTLGAGDITNLGSELKQILENDKHKIKN